MTISDMRDKAAEYLKGQGFEVLDRDWPGSAHGTLEIAARERDIFVVVVVVSGRIPRNLPAATGRRLRRIGADWMGSHGRLYPILRVDFVSVTGQRGGHAIEHERAMA